MATMLEGNYTFSVKPNPAHPAMTTFDEDRIRQEIRDIFQLTKDCRVEIVMKDNHTINHNPSHVIRWCQIAREEVERV